MGSRVLIIDPSETCRLILQTSLRRAGIESVAYADGQEVFTALREQPDLAPELVLLEAVLPAIDGYSLAPLLKAQTRLTQSTFIMLLRRDGVLDRLLGRLAGAADYLTKPFDTKQVVALVQEYLRSRAKPAGGGGATQRCRARDQMPRLSGLRSRHRGVRVSEKGWKTQ